MKTEALEVLESSDSMIVALTPAEMPAAQQALLEFCDRKIATLQAEAADLDEHRAIATANGWKLGAVVRQLALARRRIDYYRKIRIAVEAGYLIVPNMPVDVFAVRVTRASPPRDVVVGDSSWRPTPSVEPERLPVGEGRYVDDSPELAHRVGHGTDATTEHVWTMHEYADVDFPVKAVKPIVLDATARAMALKVFDQMGLVRDNGVGQAWTRRGDPIVVGQMLDPRGQGRGVTFFVAWWLNTATL